MKKVTRIFAIAALAFGMVMAVSCNKDPENEGGNGGNGGNGGGNTENLPTTIDENFNSGLPSAWTAVDADGDGYNWVASGESWFATDPNVGASYAPFGVDNTECMVSASFRNDVGELQTDNFLVMPKIYVEEGSNLSFSIASYQVEYADSYSVVVGTLQNGTFTVTGTLMDTQVASTGIREGTGFTTKTVSLNEYKGQGIYIAFRHNCSDCYWLILDNVKVSK